MDIFGTFDFENLEIAWARKCWDISGPRDRAFRDDFTRLILRSFLGTFYGPVMFLDVMTIHTYLALLELFRSILDRFCFEDVDNLASFMRLFRDIFRAF